MKCTEGYHRQKLPSENFFEVLQYIKGHDAGLVKRMTKKSRLEKLLEMVEVELKMNNTKKKIVTTGTYQNCDKQILDKLIR